MRPLSRVAATAAALTLVAAAAACDVPLTGGASSSDASPASGGTTTIDAGSVSCAEKILEPMDRAQRVGQLMLVGVPVTRNKDAVPWLSRFHLGGVLLTGSITTEIAPAARAVTRLREASPDDPSPFVAAVQEGGEAQTLRGEEFTTIPDAITQAGWSPQETVDDLVEAARALHDAGITMTLSPVADTVPSKYVDDNPLGSTRRSFGPDVNAVATQVHLSVQAVESQQVTATLKHFPGYGRLSSDPDDDAGASDDKMAIDDPSLVPFVTGIEAGADVVMMSGARYPNLDDEQPAVFSSAVITDLLRGIVNFTGVVLSSDLSTAASVEDTPVADRGVAFVKAGGDMVLSEDADQADDLLGGLAAEDSASPDFAKLVDAAALRILTVKAERGIVSCG